MGEPQLSITKINCYRIITNDYDTNNYDTNDYGTLLFRSTEYSKLGLVQFNKNRNRNSRPRSFVIGKGETRNERCHFYLLFNTEYMESF